MKAKKEEKIARLERELDLALRKRDIRDLQEDLSALGLSSLGRAEAHVLATVQVVLHALRSLQEASASGRSLHSPSSGAQALRARPRR